MVDWTGGEEKEEEGMEARRTGGRGEWEGGGGVEGRSGVSRRVGGIGEEEVRDESL